MKGRTESVISVKQQTKSYAVLLEEISVIRAIEETSQRELKLALQLLNMKIC